MKRLLIFVFATVMLLSCAACSNTQDKDTGKNSAPHSNIPIELCPPADNHGSNPEVDKKPFNKNDPRKQYLEGKYGVTAYLVAEKTTGGIYSLFALEGYEGAFRLFAKTDLVATGAPEDSITTDYVDDAWFAILYADIYAYFAQAVKDAGVDIDRIIVESKCVQSLMYDHNKPFVEELASAPKGAKRFALTIYGDFIQNPSAIDTLFKAFDELDFTGYIEFRQVLQDISNVSNTDLIHNPASVYSEFFDRKQVK